MNEPFPYEPTEREAALDALIQELYDDGTFQYGRAEETEDWWDMNSVDDVETFEHFWAEVKEYADKLKLPVWYVEAEFCIDGELIKNGRTM